MIFAWGPGGPFDRLNRRVAHDVRQHFAQNPVARRSLYSWDFRMLRLILAPATFGLFLWRYLILNLVILNLEAFTPTWAPSGIQLDESATGRAEALIKDLPSYMLGAQIGLLGVISLALALVTLIAQRNDAAADVKLYYHESLFFEIAASSLALSTVLCVQFFWPLQAILHWLGHGSSSPVFELLLVFAHMLWLAVNIWAVAHFVALTFRFVQRGARERLRERYTANVIVPQQLTDLLRKEIYLTLGRSTDRALPGADFGYNIGTADPELETDFGNGKQLTDVRIRLLDWVVTRWAARCVSENAATPNRRGYGPRLSFGIRLNEPLSRKVIWCRRTGGVPLTKFEKWVLRRAFCMGGLPNAD